MHFLGQVLAAIRWIADFVLFRPRVSALLRHGVCFALHAQDVWRYCDPAEGDAVLFLQFTVVVTNDSTSGDGILSIGLRMPPMTEIPAIQCHIGKRQPLVVIPLAARMPVAATVFFELRRERYGAVPAWILPPDLDWQLDIRSVRHAFTAVAVLPSNCLDQGPIGTVAGYDDPPVSATWIPLDNDG